MNDEKLWDYLTKTTKNSVVARKIYNYIKRYLKTQDDVEKAYSHGYYEASEKLGKKVKSLPKK